MPSKRCAGCGKSFHPRPQTPKQTYCSSAQCQKERRRRWQQARRQRDPAYRDNQARAHAAWAERHPDYWRAYRRAHPHYRERNRRLQRERDARRRAAGVLAKMDASAPFSAVPSGTYRMVAVTPDELAKRDAWMVEITVVSRSYGASA